MRNYHETSGGAYALTTSATTTDEISIESFASGQIYVPTGSPITTLTYHVSSKVGGTYFPAQDSTGSAVTQTVAATKAYPIPSALFGAVVMKIVVNSAGSVVISLKT